MADQPSPSAAAVHRISRLKVAVACTVIRTKPSHLTAKQFAESLGQKERKTQSDWKSRATELEAELLRTRQQLAMTRLREEGHFQEQHSMDWDADEIDTSQDPELIPITSSACPDRITFPTPPSSMPTEPPPKPSLHDHIRANSQFIHAMTRLHSLPDSARLAHRDVSLTLRDSFSSGVKHLLGYLGSRLDSNDALPWKLLQDAIRGIVRTLDCCRMMEARRELIKDGERLAQEVLRLIMYDDHLNKCFRKQQLCSLLVSLSSSQELIPVILNSAITHIETVALMLRQSLSHGSFEPLLSENSSYLLSVMEDVLLSPRTGSSTCKGVDGLRRGKIAGWIERLEESLLHISEDFPLFAQHVWKVVSILEWIRTLQTEIEIQ
ncbi:meiosis-specific protein MEI4-like [Asterias rubens]|uniref:meiosis-specific protein MEI4-like n=1 Tax=Asterias rubens TaxID=7604 RepID=UPI0014553CD9|nr:meiosis-specific protein MEI4-like [Asterias rubens]